MGESEHFVQFYETNDYLLDAFVFSFLRVSGRGTGWRDARIAACRRM
ncbi:MAG: hypothetical protein NVS2B16_12790 [Chloroflexota bacterium]